MALPTYNKKYALEEFQLHGEYQMQEKLSTIPMTSIFDVGCNIGEWTRMVRGFQPKALIHMFDISPFTFQKMLRNIPLDNGIFANSYGLSNATKEIPLKVVTDNDRVTTTVMNIAHDNSVYKNALVSTGDFYTKHYGIEHIDFLKIDTEGHEYETLQGFMPMIEKGKITCIQFEFGYINVLTRRFLMDYYQLLTPHGYLLGKLTKEGVKFKDYHLMDEDFKGPDYVAVHNSRPDIIELIGATV
jgi:FkbM family methyltransferase